jgi:signal transduction histidine kinase
MSEARARIRSWAVVAAALAGAASLHATFRSLLEVAPFMLFHGANFISAWHGGLLPGLVCTLLGAAIVNIFFLHPSGLVTGSLPGLIATAVFLAVGTGFSILCHSRLRALHAADEARVTRENFLTVAAHELRTPLTTLRLRLQRLGARFGASEKDDLAAALRQVVRMDGLIHQFLDAIRLQQARIELDRRTVDLGALAREVGDRLAPSVVPGLQVEALAPVVGRWDPARLEHVIANLLLNAFKFGRGKPVHVRVERNGDRALLSVRDEGIGIAREDQQRIFDRFERAVGIRQYGGLGLGLWISSQFVHAHGGTIRVESAAGKGAVFTIELPIEPAHQAGDEAHSS